MPSAIQNSTSVSSKASTSVPIAAMRTKPQCRGALVIRQRFMGVTSSQVFTLNPMTREMSESSWTVCDRSSENGHAFLLRSSDRVEFQGAPLRLEIFANFDANRRGGGRTTRPKQHLTIGGSLTKTEFTVRDDEVQFVIHLVGCRIK